MKLRDMNTEELTEALCRLVIPMSAIAEDPHMGEAMAALHRAKEAHVPLITAAGQLLRKGLPVLLQTHRAETYAILSVLTGKSIDTLRAQNGFDTLRDAWTCIDKDILSFFTCAGQEAQGT